LGFGVQTLSAVADTMRSFCRHKRTQRDGENSIDTTDIITAAKDFKFFPLLQNHNQKKKKTQTPLSHFPLEFEFKIPSQNPFIDA
jgi:hypothetical protein